jgi:hypothetical protein
VEDKQKDLKVAYTSLKDSIQGVILQLGFTEK